MLFDLSFSKIIVILIVFFIIAFVYIIFRVSPEQIKRSRFYTFMGLLAGAASLFVALSLYHNSATQERNEQRQLRLSTIQVIKDLLLAPVIKLAERYDDLGELPDQMYPEIEVRSKTDMNQLSMAIYIFQIFEDYKTLYQDDKTGLDVWLGSFLQWIQSNVLQQLWPKLKIIYKQSTVEFVDFLIKAARQLQTLRKQRRAKLTFDDYHKVIKAIEPEAMEILSKPD